MENQIVFAASAAATINLVLYTGKVHVAGRRQGAAKSANAHLIH